MADKYNSPSGPPPQYPPQVHHDAGPYYPNPTGSPAPGPMNQMSTYSQGQGQDGYYAQGYPQQEYQRGYQQGYGPPQQQQYYGPPQPGMYYQQGPPNGYYEGDRGRGGGAAGGICAGLLGALACCCCLDFLF